MQYHILIQVIIFSFFYIITDIIPLRWSVVILQESCHIILSSTWGDQLRNFWSFLLAREWTSGWIIIDQLSEFFLMHPCEFMLWLRSTDGDSQKRVFFVMFMGSFFHKEVCTTSWCFYNLQVMFWCICILLAEVIGWVITIENLLKRLFCTIFLFSCKRYNFKICWYINIFFYTLF